MRSDLEIAVSALVTKHAPQTTLFDYYSGDQPVVYTNERLRDIFANVSARFTENWSAVVIDACADRITLAGFSVSGDDLAQAFIDDAWTSLSLAIETDDAHDAALVAGESFIIAWLDLVTGGIGACYHDPRMCHVQYEAASPRTKRFGAKWWDDEDGRRLLTLYYADRLETYQTRGKKPDDPVQQLSVKSFDLADTQANPFGVIPVFHLENKRRASDLQSVLPIQDGINKLLIDMMVSAEFGAFQQRYIISNAEKGAKLKNSPNEVWELSAGDGVGQQTQVGQFAATKLGNYIDAISGRVSSLGAITRTPKHYFFQQGGDPSGESLLAMEAPLNKKAQDRIDRFTPPMRELGAFLLQLGGFSVSPSAVTPLYLKPETVQPLTQAQVRKVNVEVGIPLRNVLRDEGWSDAEIEQMDADRTADQAAQGASLASAMLDAQGRFDRGEMA